MSLNGSGIPSAGKVVNISEEAAAEMLVHFKSLSITDNALDTQLALLKSHLLLVCSPFLRPEMISDIDGKSLRFNFSVQIGSQSLTYPNYHQLVVEYLQRVLTIFIHTVEPTYLEVSIEGNEHIQMLLSLPSLVQEGRQFVTQFCYIKSLESIFNLTDPALINILKLFIVDQDDRANINLIRFMLSPVDDPNNPMMSIKRKGIKAILDHLGIPFKLLMIDHKIHFQIQTQHIADQLAPLETLSSDYQPQIINNCMIAYNHVISPSVNPTEQNRRLRQFATHLNSLFPQLKFDASAPDSNLIVVNEAEDNKACGNLIIWLGTGNRNGSSLLFSNGLQQMIFDYFRERKIPYEKNLSGSGNLPYIVILANHLPTLIADNDNRDNHVNHINLLYRVPTATTRRRDKVVVASTEDKKTALNLMAVVPLLTASFDHQPPMESWYAKWFETFIYQNPLLLEFQESLMRLIHSAVEQPDKITLRETLVDAILQLEPSRNDYRDSKEKARQLSLLFTRNPELRILFDKYMATLVEANDDWQQHLKGKQPKPIRN